MTDSSESVIERGNYFREPFLKADVASGTLRDRSGRRMVALNEDFLTGFRDGIVEECGIAANEVLGTCGRVFGELWGKRFERELEDHHGVPIRELPLGVFQASLREAFTVHGWGTLDLDFAHEASGVIVARIDNAVYGSLVGEAGDPVDGLWGGLLAGVFGRLAGTALDALQTDCLATGAATSRFLISERSRIAELREDYENGAVPHAEALEQLLELRVAD